MSRRNAVTVACVALAVCFGMNRIADAQEAQRPGIYIEAEPNFQTSLAAAIIKKHVPVQIVTDKSKADYVLKASGVNAHTESGASQFARCLLAYCVGADGSSSVSVQLVKSDAVVWAYQVRKANGGPAGIQSLAEAIAKHLKNNFMNGQK